MNFYTYHRTNKGKMNSYDESILTEYQTQKKYQANCPFCQAVFDKDYFVLRHLADSHFRERLCEGLQPGLDVYKCAECDHKSKDQREFARHSGLVHYMVKKFLKEMGIEDFSKSAAEVEKQLQIQKEESDQISMECPICKKDYSNVREFLQHTTNAHFEENSQNGLSSGIPFKCPADNCESKFNNLNSLVIHYSLAHKIVFKISNEYAGKLDPASEAKSNEQARTVKSTPNAEKTVTESSTIKLTCPFCPKIQRSKKDFFLHLFNKHQKRIKKSKKYLPPNYDMCHEDEMLLNSLNEHKSKCDDSCGFIY